MYSSFKISTSYTSPKYLTSSWIFLVFVLIWQIIYWNILGSGCVNILAGRTTKLQKSMDYSYTSADPEISQRGWKWINIMPIHPFRYMQLYKPFPSVFFISVFALFVDFFLFFWIFPVFWKFKIPIATSMYPLMFDSFWLYYYHFTVHVSETKHLYM